MNYYFLTLECRVSCSCCNERVHVKVDGTLDFDEEGMYCVDDQIKEALETAQADDGWLDDWCPRCARNNAREIHLANESDNYAKEVVL